MERTHRSTVPLALLWLLACLPLARAGQREEKPASVAQLLGEARVLLDQKKDGEAFGKLTQVVKLEPENIDALELVAALHARRGEFHQAIDTIRKLQVLGVSLFKSLETKMALDAAMSGIRALGNLRDRASEFAYARQTLRGLPAEVECFIDANLMAIYAKLGDEANHDAAKARCLQGRDVVPSFLLTVGRTYLDYGVRAQDAARLIERAIDLTESQQTAGPEGAPQDVALNRARRDALLADTQDLLALAYFQGALHDPAQNRLILAEPMPGTTFADVTEAAGLKGVTAPRIAVGDFDGDGFDDLCAAGRILRNQGGKAFADVTKQAGIDPAGVLAVLWLDYDNDGKLDLLCTGFPRMRLWRNRGDGTFEDVTTKAGLGLDLPGLPLAAAAADYDGDGAIDLFLGCSEDPRQPGVGQPDFLFHNTGKGSFEDASASADIRGEASYCTRACAWADFNNDGLADLYVCNDRLGPNQLWVNQGKGKFADQAQQAAVIGPPGPARYAPAFGNSIGCAWGDIDNDGSFDLLVANVPFRDVTYVPNSLAIYVNTGRGARWQFVDFFPLSGVRYEDALAAVSLCDFDNDGDLDIYLTGLDGEHPSFLYQNGGRQKFRPVTWRTGVLLFGAASQAWFDKDNDGDMDLVVCGNQGLRLFENQAKDTSWLRVRLVGSRSNRLGVGARVTVQAGTLLAVREVAAGSGDGSQASPILHFGLGSHKDPVVLTVRWPGGDTQRFTDVAPNQLLKIEEKKK